MTAATLPAPFDGAPVVRDAADAFALADALRADMERLADMSRRHHGAKATAERRRLGAVMRRYEQRVQMARDVLAEGFADRHGLRRADKGYSAAVLARGGVHDGGIPRDDWSWFAADHRYFFRRNRKASAVAAHVYGTRNPDKVHADCMAFAERAGLQVTFPTDWPSWWYPGETILVVFWPGTVAHAA